MQSLWDDALVLTNGDDIPAVCPPLGMRTLIVCADGAVRHALYYGLVPHVIVGDFDSISPVQAKKAADWEPQWIEHCVEKDDTDFELAVKHCLREGVRRFSVIGLLGGRVDHSLGSLEVLYALALQGCQVTAYGASVDLHAVSDRIHLAIAKDTIVSLIPMGAYVEGVTTSGLQYPLNNATLQKGSTLGISNKASASSAVVSVRRGVLLVAVVYEE